MPYAELLPSGKYRAVYRTKDGARRSAGTFTHKRKAEIEAARAEDDARAPGWRDPRSAGRPWKEWCAEWWPTRDVEPGTLHRDEPSRDKHLLPRWGDVALADITRHDVKAWATQLKKEGLAPATVQKRIHLLSASLVAAVDAEIIPGNPAARIKVTTAADSDEVRRYLESAEVDRLFKAFGPDEYAAQDRSIAGVLLGTGMRWGEMAGLQVKRVDFERRLLHVVEVWDDDQRRLKAYPKGRRRREVPMSEAVAEILEQEIAGRKTGHAILWRGRYVLDYSNWRRSVWLPAVAAAELDGTRIHDLRHTFASMALQAGLSLEEVGKLLGHLSPQTTQVYAKLARTFDDRVVAALPAVPRGASRGATWGRDTLEPIGKVS